MTRRRAIQGIIAALVVLVVAYVARHTYWAEVRIPLPPQGEAATNPFYAAQRFAQTLGARAVRHRTFTTPPPDAVVVLSSWHWSLSSRRRIALERWVDEGGRLVVDNSLLYPLDDFERWSGISWDWPEEDPDAEESDDDAQPGPLCRTMSEDAGPGGSRGGSFWLCTYSDSWLTSRNPIEWGLRDAAGLQAARVAIGRGSVTVLNAAPFRGRELFNGDHGVIFVAAAQLTRGDDVRFLSEEDHPSLPVLAWQQGASVIVLLLAGVVLGVWRGAVRFGPVVPVPEPVRRSLAEQIRGTARFILRYGDGEPLHAAAVRALHETAARHLPRYTRLSPDERAAALARVTGFERAALAAAIHHAGLRTPHELRGTITLLESARRAVLTQHSGRIHGTR